MKLENVLLTADGYAKLADFGLAKRTAHATNSFCGTPEYMAPEVILRNNYSTSVDWWGLGVLMYQMVVDRVRIQCKLDLHMEEECCSLTA